MKYGGREGSPAAGRSGTRLGKRREKAGRSGGRCRLSIKGGACGQGYFMPPGHVYVELLAMESDAVDRKLSRH